MRKPANIFLLAIIVGALSAAMIYRHLKTMNMEVEAARAAGQHPVTDVVVARDTISIGTRISPDTLKVVTWPADAQPEGAVHDPQAVVGNIARTTIGKNQPVATTALIAQGAGLLPLMIDEGMRAMSVKVDSVTGVSGFITPNSHVDVLVAATRGEKNDMRSRVIMQNIKVLATGTIIEQKDEKPVEVPTVTLLITPEQAETLTLATRYDSVRLALRNYRDEELVQTTGTSAAAMFHDEPPAGPIALASDRETSGSCVPTGPTVEVFLGEKLVLQPMFDDKKHGWARVEGGGA